jgi:hypothetical protein
MARNDTAYYSKSDAIAERPSPALGAKPETMKILLVFILLQERPPPHGTADSLVPQRWCYVFTKPENKK